MATKPTTEVTDRPLRFRIKVGVTGHRELAHEEELRARIREVLATTIVEEHEKHIAGLPAKEKGPSLRDFDTAGDGSAISFTVLSPLAEGADRLVAEVVLDQGGSLDAILPMHEPDYLRTFGSEAAREEFSQLLKKATFTSRLPAPPLGDMEGELLEETRRDAYESVGRFVVDYCDVLLAIWDGEESRGRGGTAEIVNYAKERNCPLVILSSEAPHDITVEWGNGIDTCAVKELERLNQLSIPQANLTGYLDNASAEIFPDEPEDPAARLPQHAKDAVRNCLLPFYVKASDFAKRAQRRYKRAGRCVYVLAPLSVAAVAAAVIAPKWTTLCFVLEFLFLAAILVVVTLAHRCRCHVQWIEYRFLVEKIRSAIHLGAASFPSSPIRIPPHLGVAHGPHDWMVRVFDEIWACLGGMPQPADEALSPARDFLAGSWVGGQVDYHRGKRNDAGRKSHLLERLGVGVFLLALGAAGAHVVFPPLLHLHHGDPLDQFLFFLAIVLPGVGAALGGLRSHAEFSRLAKRSESMEAALTSVQDRLSRANSRHQIHSLTHEAEGLILLEVQDWLTLMRFTDIEAEV